jgi:hypothetical protein
MSKSGGLGANFYVDGIDLSNDVGELSRIGGGNSPLIVTGIDKYGIERIGGKRDGSMEFKTFRNPALGKEFDTLSPLTRSSRVATYVHNAATLGSSAASMYAKQIGYDPTRGEDGSYTNAIAALSTDYGLEWGRTLTTGKRTDVAATNGTGVDFTASSAFGLQAWCHLFAFTGTSATVKIQESSDNGVGDAWADVVGGSFGALTTVGPYRLATATNLSVERYLRVITTGTFSNVIFAVQVTRNEVTPAF